MSNYRDMVDEYEAKKLLENANLRATAATDKRDNEATGTDPIDGEGTTEEATEYYIEPPTGEYIAAAFNAMAAVDTIDTFMMADKEKVAEMKKSINRKSLEIINNQINEIYDYLMGE